MTLVRYQNQLPSLFDKFFNNELEGWNRKNYSTTNILVRRECGRNPLLEKNFNRNINYFNYLKSKSIVFFKVFFESGH